MTAQAGRPLAARRPRTRRQQARIAVAVALLAAAGVVWAAAPVHAGRAGTGPVLVLAGAAVLLTVTRLAADMVAERTEVMPRLDAALYRSPLASAAIRVAATTLALPWPQVVVVTTLALEALHPARPWHTAVLGAVLLAFLLTLHLATSGDGPGVLRPHLPLVAAGLGLAALSAGAALLPTAGPGWLAAVAAIAALLTAGLALPL